MYKVYFFRSLLSVFFVVSVSLFTACNSGKQSDGGDDNNVIIAKLQEQLEALQQRSGVDQQTLAQISELQKTILELQQNSGNTQVAQDPQTTALIADLQRKINELSEKTLDGSAIVSCTCLRPPDVYARILEGSGANKAEAVQNAIETCKSLQDHDGAYVKNCTVKE